MTYPNETYLFFHDIQNHFIKKGKRETLEKYFRKKLLTRSKLKKPSMYNLLSNAVLSTTPFIRLKAKKRRKYTLYKVHAATKEWSRRKAVGSFAKSVKEQKTKDLFGSVEKELILLKTGKSTVQQKRDEYHKLALKVTPYRWKKLIYLKRWRDRMENQHTKSKEKSYRDKSNSKSQSKSIVKPKNDLSNSTFEEFKISVGNKKNSVARKENVLDKNIKASSKEKTISK